VNRPIAVLSLLYFVLSARDVSAEVVDKVPSQFSILAWAVLWSAFGFLGTAKFKWVAVFTFPLAVFRPTRALFEIFDPHVGPAIVNDVGYYYSATVFGSLLLVLAAHVAGLIVANRQSEARGENDASVT